MKPFFGAAREPCLKDPFTCGSDSRADNIGVNILLAPSVALARPGGLAARRALSRRWPAGLAAALLLTGLALPGARAGDKHDHERARAAMLAGEVMPLPELLARLQRTHPGQVLELELEREHGRWLYEVRLLQANGQLVKLELDARSGAVLQVKRRPDRARDRAPEPPKEPTK